MSKTSFDFAINPKISFSSKQKLEAIQTIELMTLLCPERVLVPWQNMFVYVSHCFSSTFPHSLFSNLCFCKWHTMSMNTRPNLFLCLLFFLRCSIYCECHSKPKKGIVTVHFVHCVWRLINSFVLTSNLFCVKHVEWSLENVEMQLSLMKIYKRRKFSFHFLSFFSLAFSFLAKHFNIFSVFPTKSKACGGLEKIKVADMELGGDNFISGSERAARDGCWRGAFREV